MPHAISPRQLNEKRANGDAIVLLDVRQGWERELASIPDSSFIPLGELMSRIDELPPPDHRMVVLYCHHGIRSLSGAAVLEQVGYRDVYSLTGGIDAWSCDVDPTVPRY